MDLIGFFPSTFCPAPQVQKPRNQISQNPLGIRILDIFHHLEAYACKLGVLLMAFKHYVENHPLNTVDMKTIKDCFCNPVTFSSSTFV